MSEIWLINGVRFYLKNGDWVANDLPGIKLSRVWSETWGAKYQGEEVYGEGPSEALSSLMQVLSHKAAKLAALVGTYRDLEVKGVGDELECGRCEEE